MTRQNEKVSIPVQHSIGGMRPSFTVFCPRDARLLDLCFATLKRLYRSCGGSLPHLTCKQLRSVLEKLFIAAKFLSAHLSRRDEHSGGLSIEELLQELAPYVVLLVTSPQSPALTAYSPLSHCLSSQKPPISSAEPGNPGSGALCTSARPSTSPSHGGQPGAERQRLLGAALNHTSHEGFSPIRMPCRQVAFSHRTMAAPAPSIGSPPATIEGPLFALASPPNRWPALLSSPTTCSKDSWSGKMASTGFWTVAFRSPVTS